MYELIKKFCDDKGISIEQFEKICNFSENYVYKLQYGNPGSKRLMRISQVLDVPVEELYKLFIQKGEK